MKFESEKDVKREVKKLLTKHKWKWWMPAANGFGNTGVADFNALRDGVFLAVETKFGKNKPTPQQVKFLRDVHTNGGFAFVVNEVTVFSLEVWLTAFDAAAQAVGEGRKVTPAEGALMLNAIASMTEYLA